MRFMLLLLLTHARTYHSAQGLRHGFFPRAPSSTAARDASASSTYVGISRVTVLKDLHLINRLKANDFEGTQDLNVELVIGPLAQWGAQHHLPTYRVGTDKN